MSEESQDDIYVATAQCAHCGTTHIFREKQKGGILKIGHNGICSNCKEGLGLAVFSQEEIARFYKSGIIIKR